MKTVQFRNFKAALTFWTLFFHLHLLVLWLGLQI